MKVIIEEIIKRHPAGTNPAGYLRQRIGEFFIDRLSEFPTEPGSDIWLDHLTPIGAVSGQPLDTTKRVPRLILCGRIATMMNTGGGREIGLLMDVVEIDVYKEIVRSLRGKDVNSLDEHIYSREYVQWAKDQKVWP
jgi:hypothetical protein